MHRFGHWFEEVYIGVKCKLCGLVIPFSPTLSKADQADLVDHCLYKGGKSPEFGNFECPQKEKALKIVEEII